MNRNASRAAVVLALLLAGVVTANAQRDYKDQSLDLLRFLATKPFATTGHNRWDRGPRFDMDLTDRFGTRERWGIKPKMIILRNDDDARTNMGSDDSRLNVDNEIKMGSAKRSAVATALNGRRRRQPAAALGKEVTPYVGVGVLSSVDTFFDSLRDNLEGLAYLSPQQRATLFTDAPSVVRAPSSGGGGGVGGGTGMRRLNALRPLRPTGNIRTYNRRSFVETDGLYPGANHHDPGLLWTGLGR